MSVAFSEVLPNSGFDSSTPTGGAGIVIPHKGAGIVILEGGKDLKLTTVLKQMLEVDELKNHNYQQALIDARYDSGATGKTLDLASLKSGALRLFKITANALVGIGAKIEAVNAKKKTEAILKVLVLRQKRVKVAIRPVQVRDNNGVPVNSAANPGDPNKLLDQMNYIWRPQANVVYELGKTDPVTIDQLKPGQPADITDEDLKAAFIAKKDPDADLTFFMVKRAVNKESTDLGVINSEAGFSLISDDRSDFTMAHEAGHFLGSLSEKGKFSMKYGHQGTADNLLMRAGGAGSKIPFHLVTDFNKGYRG
jgi:hypothetical protein